MALFNSDRLNDKLKSVAPATPSENVPKGLYVGKVLTAQRGRESKNDIYLKFRLTPQGQADARTYTMGKLFKIGSSEGRSEQELSDFMAAAAALGFTTAQLSKDDFAITDLVGHECVVGIEELKGKDGRPFSVTGYGAWFRVESQDEIHWVPRGVDEAASTDDDQGEAESFRQRGREYAANRR